MRDFYALVAVFAAAWVLTGIPPFTAMHARIDKYGCRFRCAGLVCFLLGSAVDVASGAPSERWAVYCVGLGLVVAGNVEQTLRIRGWLPP
jgi:hypothetical protein